MHEPIFGLRAAESSCTTFQRSQSFLKRDTSHQTFEYSDTCPIA